jgi:lipoprotein-releasing system ATP-binding protein
MGISANNIFKTFGQPPTAVLSDVSLEVADAEFVAITGRSGSGKSTLLYILSSLDSPSEGSLKIDSQDVTQMSPVTLHQFRNLRMGFVFQFHYLLPELSVLENVLMPAMKEGVTAVIRTYAEKLLVDFGLGEKLSRLPAQLSGGESQRVAIARALVMEPRYLFADEPTGNLDSVNGNAVMELFEKINKEKHVTIVFVTHDVDFAQRAHRQIQMVDGRISQDVRRRR